jgi:hypothetical protein
MAIAGGALRAAASFAPVLIQSDLARESLYIVVDACLAAGLLAIDSLRPRRGGRWGTAGLTLALAGIATVRANRLISTTDLYPAGALAIVVGMIALSVSAWLVRQIRGWVPAAFILSTLLGVVGTFVQGANVLFIWSGVMFGIAFAGLGIDTWISASS